MHFNRDQEFTTDDYVTREQFAKRYPKGAQGRLCRYCGRLLIVAVDREPDCGRHVN